MSDFSEEWLSLREVADCRARSAVLLAAVSRWSDAAGADLNRPFTVVDLGSGTGNALRALAPYLPVPQLWTLADRNPDLLARAQAESGSGLCAGLRQRGAVRVRTRVCDLSEKGTLETLIDGAQLAVASALIDLVSDAWCERLITALASRRTALYATLIYDGRFDLTPAHSFDPIVRELFNQHQQQAKTLGPALGPAASTVLRRSAEAAGAAVLSAVSDWTLGPGQRSLSIALLNGWAKAGRELAPSAADAIDAWVQSREAQMDAGELRIRVGHRDLFAAWESPAVS